MFRKGLIITAALLPAAHTHSAGMDLKLSSETAEVTLLTQSATFGYGGADIGFGLFLNEKDDFLANASIVVSGSGTGDVRALHFGVGGKAYAGRLDFEPNNRSGGAVAIGGNLRYVFPASTPFAILGEAFWAPSVTSFSDFDGIVEYRVAFELEVTPSARAYVGYRVIEVELDNGVDYKADDNAHIGVRFAF